MWHRRVVWSEGLFLRPQHFQQQQRHLDHHVDRRVKAVAGHGWGFERLEFEESALAMGKLALRTATGVLPDGTAFAAPLDDALPAPLDIGSHKDQLLYIGVVQARPGMPQTVLGEAPPRSLFRYEAQSADLPDDNEGFVEPAPVQLGALRLVLMTAAERTDAFSAMPVARLIERRADNQVVLDPAFIAPTLSSNDSANLASWLSEVRGKLHQTSEVLSRSMTQPGRGGVSEIAEFMWLQVVNRHGLLFDHLASLPRLHPERLYANCLQLAGDLVAFCPQRRFDKPFASYDHDDLRATFRPVIEFLREAFGHLPQKSSVRIELHDRGHNVRVATVGDRELLEKGTFVLAANAQMPSESLRLRFPNQTKVAPVDRLQELVRHALAGVPMRAMPMVPRQIPFHAGFNYFELDTRDELWRQIARSGYISLHVAGEFPGLELELWAIRD